MRMKNKFLAAAFSVAVAFSLWLFVITVVSPESEKTYFDIPVVLQNKDVLEQRGLMVVSDTPKVTLSLKSDRTILNDLNENNINVLVNLTNVETAGTHDLTYDISYPGNISPGSVSVQSSSTEMITLKVEKRVSKKVPIVMVAKQDSKLPEEYFTDLSKAEFTTRHDNQPVAITDVEISGPETVISQITQAVIDVDLNTNLKSLEDKTEVYTLCDEDGKAVNAEKVTTNVDVVQVTLRILKEKTIEITSKIIPGKGAEESNARVTLGQQSIVIRGEKDRVEALPATVAIPIDLGEYFESGTFEVDLNDIGIDLSGMEIHTGKAQVEVTLEFTGVAIAEFTIPVKTVNVPPGVQIASQAERITVTVRGPKEAIRYMSGSDLLAQVDCTNVTGGRNELTAQITCEKYPKVAVTSGDHKVMLDVKINTTAKAAPQK